MLQVGESRKVDCVLVYSVLFTFWDFCFYLFDFCAFPFRHHQPFQGVVIKDKSKNFFLSSTSSMIAPLANTTTSPEAVTKMATDTFIGNNHNTADLTVWQQCVNTDYCVHRTLFSTCISFIIVCLQGFQCSNPQFDPHLYLNQAYCMCCKLPKEAGKLETKQTVIFKASAFPTCTLKECCSDIPYI